MPLSLSNFEEAERFWSSPIWAAFHLTYLFRVQQASADRQTHIEADQLFFIRRQLEVTQARFHADFSALQAQHASAQERARASADALAAAARDAESWRGRCASSERELAATRADAEDARRAVGALEARLKEYKLKDATAFQSVKKAKEEVRKCRRNGKLAAGFEGRERAAVPGCTEGGIVQYFDGAMCHCALFCWSDKERFEDTLKASSAPESVAGHDHFRKRTMCLAANVWSPSFKSVHVSF
jgi:hypothetical protein